MSRYVSHDVARIRQLSGFQVVNLSNTIVGYSYHNIVLLMRTQATLYTTFQTYVLHDVMLVFRVGLLLNASLSTIELHFQQWCMLLSWELCSGYHRRRVFYLLSGIY